MVRHMPNQQMHLDRVFRALGDPTRRAVLSRLRRGERARALLRHGAALVHATSRRSRTERPGALAQGRPRAHLSARAAAAEGGRALDGATARAVGAPPRSTRQVSAGTEGGDEVTATVQHDPRLDLVLERVVDVAPELVWAAWTKPEHVKKWFTPAPWKTVDCEIDLRPGGIFRTVMRSPQGQDITNVGCFLEIVANRK